MWNTLLSFNLAPDFMDINDSNQTCTSETVVNYSSICVDWEHELFNMEACNHLNHAMSLYAAVICIGNALIGCCGNLLTLLAIPYSVYNNKFGFKRSRDTATILIMNLAFADFVYCLVNLPLYSIQYWSGRWPFGGTACRYFAAFRYWNAFAEWMSLAIIALSRCIGLVRNQRCFSWKQGQLIVLAIWVYAAILVSIVLTEIYGKFGYNCMIGKCDFLRVQPNRMDPHLVFYSIAFGIPCFVILISYSVIWCYAKNSAKYLRQSSEENRRLVMKRESSMTRTLFAICVCYIIFVGPIAIVNIIDPTGQLPALHLTFFCLYWFQYSLNFLIYAARCQQYKRAYAFLLGQMFPCCCQFTAKATLIILNGHNRVEANHQPITRPGAEIGINNLLEISKEPTSKSVMSSLNAAVVLVDKRHSWNRSIIYETMTDNEMWTTGIQVGMNQEEVTLRIHTHMKSRIRTMTM
ncbi:hypothetical protein TCAL_13052 [Tigriopus californicus]|uniref:G-protein coupled receptors family 1 profile domain-containing protein n=1 Tax=Tigriopus californicus TaxID=6832 RepID=A0A553PGX9_TIGCA|nr:protein trapped in endoderm-1-like [Tigriopus californicus]TRY76927.1 hypothetical protein TCAL_13052 [Tigriopus californicus]